MEKLREFASVIPSEFTNKILNNPDFLKDPSKYVEDLLSKATPEKRKQIEDSIAPVVKALGLQGNGSSVEKALNFLRKKPVVGAGFDYGHLDKNPKIKEDSSISSSSDSNQTIVWIIVGVIFAFVVVFFLWYWQKVRRRRLHSHESSSQLSESDESSVDDCVEFGVLDSPVPNENLEDLLVAPETWRGDRFDEDGQNNSFGNYMRGSDWGKNYA